MKDINVGNSPEGAVMRVERGAMMYFRKKCLNLSFLIERDRFYEGIVG